MPPERVARRRLRMRRQLCKRCAASARRRSWRPSLRSNDFLHERFETRIATQGVEQGIHFDPGETGTVPGGDCPFNGAKSFLFVVEAQKNERPRVLVDVLILKGLVEILQSLLGCVLVPRQTPRRSQQSHHKGIAT